VNSVNSKKKSIVRYNDNWLHRLSVGKKRQDLCSWCNLV